MPKTIIKYAPHIEESQKRVSESLKDVVSEIDLEAESSDSETEVERSKRRIRKKSDRSKVDDARRLYKATMLGFDCELNIVAE